MKAWTLPRYLGALFLACLCVAVLELNLLQYRFAGYDLSPLIDAGWRVHLGQVPNRDFVCTFPPVLYLGVASAFRILGVRWLAVTVAGVLFSLAATCAGLRVISLLRTRMEDGPLRWLAAVYCGLQLTPLLAVGFPWHSTWTETVAVYALLALFAVVQSAPVQGGALPRRASMELIGHLVLAGALLLLCKPNVAAPVLLSCEVVLLLTAGWRVALGGLTGSVALATAALRCVHTSLPSTFGVYSHLSSRFRPGGYLAGILYNRDLAVGFQHWIVYVLLLPVAGWCAAELLRGRAGAPLAVRVLALGAALTTWVGMGTNVEFRLVDAPCLLLGAALLSLSLPGRQVFARAAVSAATYALLAAALFYGLSRARMQEAGVWAEAETCGLEATVHDRFFGEFTSCRNLLSVLSQTDATLAAARPPSVFFGPRMEFLYARERQVPPRGLPLWWHPGSSYPSTEVPEIVRAFDQDRPAMLLFLHDDRSYLPKPLLEHMERDYRLVPHPAGDQFADLADDSTAHVDVYVRR